MPSTNANKIEDSEKQALALKSSTHLTTPSQPNKDLPSQELERQPVSKMSKIQHIFLCCVILLIFTFTVSSAAANGAIKAVTLEERLRFQELLDSVEPAALHDVLHRHMKDQYQHGVYQEDKTAMEVVHQTRPEVAQSLVELAKRQSSNSTASTSPASSTAVVVPDTSTTSQVPVTPSTTPVDPTPTPTPSATPTQPSTSQAPTTTAVQPTQSTAVTTSPSTTAVVVPPSTTPTTRASTSPVTTPTTSQKSSTNAPQSTTTRASTTTAPTTSRSVTQQIVYTTTLANGAPTTVTSITVVPADQAENTGSATKTNPNASLQTNGGNARNQLGLTGLLGAIGVVVVGAL